MKENNPNVKGCSGGEARALRLHPWLNKPGLQKGGGWFVLQR